MVGRGDVLEMNKEKIEYLEIFKTINNRDGLFYYKNYDESVEKKLTRHDLTRQFSFAIPNEETLKEIIKYSPLIEIGAGNGYWAYLIDKFGGDIIAFDNNERNDEWLKSERELYFSTYWFEYFLISVSFPLLTSNQ